MADFTNQERAAYLLGMATASLNLSTMLARVLADAGKINPADLDWLDHALTGHLDRSQDDPLFAMQERLRSDLEAAYGQSLADILHSARRNFRDR